MIDVTPEVAQYYQDACDAWKTWEEEEVRAEFPGLSKADACEWSIRGFTIDHWLNLEITIQQLKQYADTLREHVHFYRRQLKDRQETMED